MELICKVCKKGEIEYWRLTLEDEKVYEVCNKCGFIHDDTRTVEQVVSKSNKPVQVTFNISNIHSSICVVCRNNDIGNCMYHNMKVDDIDLKWCIYWREIIE